MIYPQGKIIFQNLNTSFTNLEEILIRLKEERHTGYVHLRYWEYDAARFMDGVREELITVKENHAGVIEAFNLDSFLPILLA